MASYQKDLYKGSEYQRGVANSRRTVARIRGLVKLEGGEIDSRSGLKSAADAAVSAKGVNHPDNSTLPTQTARARMAGSAHAIVDMRFFRVPTSDTTLDPFELPSIRGGVRQRSVLRFVGTEGGDTSIGTAHFREYFRHESVVRIRVPWSRVDSPLSSVPDINQVNADQVSMSGKTFGTHTLLFESVHQDAFELEGTTQFDGFYDFTFNKDTWTRDEPTDKSTYGTTHVGTVAEFNAVNFSGNFPT